MRRIRRLIAQWYNRLFYFPKLKQRVLETADLRDKSESGLKAIADNERLLKLAYRKIKEKEAYKKLRRKDVILWKVLYGKKLALTIGKCEKCGGRNGGLTVDHIIPNSILKDFGVDPELHYDERNLRLLCKCCNSLKSNHLDFSDDRTKPLLLELLLKVKGSVRFVDLKTENIQVVPSSKFALMP
jgi:5-methylcytosine-specific restriction endonuclease McrA